jgi:trimeric autotransporter adhesin
MKFPGSAVYLFPVLGVITALTGCGGSSNSGGTTQTTTPAPTVTSVSPSKLAAGSASITLIVNGTGFTSSTVIDVNAVAEGTTYVNGTQVTAAVPSGQLASGAVLSVVAVNGAESSSQAVSLEVDNPAPTISEISPNAVGTGATSASVSVIGTGFVPTTVIDSNGSPRTTVYVSGTQMNVTLSSADVAAAGTLSLTAVTPAPGGGTSTASSVNVANLPPTVASFSPRTVLAGASNPTTITVTGTNFNAGTMVQLNGSSRATTVVSATQLTFQLTVADQASTQQLALTVVNPAPGGGAANAGYLLVLAQTPTPVISQVTPSQMIVGSGATYIVVYGTNLSQLSGANFYNLTSTVLWNGTPLTTLLFNPAGSIQTIEAQVPASLLTSTGTATITVSSSSSTPAVSNSLTVSIVNPPPPTLTSINPSAVPINTSTTVTLSGSGFTSSSTVAFNGSVLPATYVNSAQLTVTVPASSVPLPSNNTFTVTTPAPGGGTSPPLYLTSYIAILNNSMIYNPANGLFYLSVPGAAGVPYGNSIVSVDPETGALGTPIFVGSEPNKLALSSDGTILWVGLDGASAVREVNLVTNTAGLQFTLGGNSGIYANPATALALAALPGSPSSVVVSFAANYSDAMLAIFDNGVMRGSGISGYAVGTTDAFQVDGARSEIYAGSQSGYATYTYNSSGLTLLATGATTSEYASSSNDEMQVADGLLYTDFGTVYDAESGALVGTLYNSGTTPAAGTTYADATLSEAFVLDASSTLYGSAANQIQVFNTSNYTQESTSVIPVSYVTSSASSLYTSTSGPTRLTRWGTDGLAFRTNAGVFSVRSNLVKDLSSVNADLAVTLATSGSSATGGTTTFTATVNNNGPSAATNVALTALLPSTGVLSSATSSTGSCFVSTVVNCNLGGLASGGTATVSVAVRQLTAGSSALTAQVSGSETDPNPSNNQATSTSTITGSNYNPSPTVASISPAAVKSGSGDTEITLTGAGFSSGSTVLLNGQPLTTSFGSAGTISATVPAASLASMGWGAITVSNPAPGGGASSPLPLTVYSVITLGVNHILYDPYSRNIMASVGSGSTQVTGNSIVAITPATGTVGTPVAIGSQPTNMALTSDGQILYTILAGSQSVARFNMLTQQADYTYPVPQVANADGTQSLRGIAVQPGTENTIALDLGSWAGNAIYDFDPTTQTAAIRGQASGPYSGSCIQFLDAGDLLAFDTDTTGATFDHYTVSSAGFTYYNYSQYSESTLNGFGCFKVGGGLAFANAGGVANPATVPATQAGVFARQTGGGEFSTSLSFVPDSSLQEAFYVQAPSYSGQPDGIQAFDENTFLPTLSLPINMAATEGTSSNFTVVDCIRWGQDGLALLTSGGHIYLLRGGFVVPGLLSTSSAATLTASSQATIAHGTGNTLLTLTGSNFQPGVAVTWNGSYRTTTIVDATHITVAIPSSDLASTGSGLLVATNPGASASAALTVTVN